MPYASAFKKFFALIPQISDRIYEHIALRAPMGRNGSDMGRKVDSILRFYQAHIYSIHYKRPFIDPACQWGQGWPPAGLRY